MLSLIEAISPTSRELLKVEPHWFVIKSPERKFSLLASAKRRPQLPPGHEVKGPFKTRLNAVVKSLKWELETRPENNPCPSVSIRG